MSDFSVERAHPLFFNVDSRTNLAQDVDRIRKTPNMMTRATEGGVSGGWGCVGRGGVKGARTFCWRRIGTQVKHAWRWPRRARGHRAWPFVILFN